MRVLLSMIGSGGDVLPFTRLARALLARGHAVTVQTWSPYHAWFPEGARVLAPAHDVDTAALHRAFAEALPMSTPWEQIGRFARTFYGLDRGRDAARTAAAHARTVATGHDVAICDVLDHMGQLGCDAAGVPWFSWASRPAPVPKDVDGPLAPVDDALSAFFSIAGGARRRVQTFRARGPLGDLVNASPALVLPHPHHPEAIVTGAWLDPAPAPADAALPESIARFLDAGPALLVSFGTTPDLRGRTTALLAAAARTGWRTILQVLPPDEPPRWVPPGTLVVQNRLPFAALLPRLASFVHHGGAGTLHEACRAGCPSLAMPHMADQYYWSRALATHGLGPRPVAHTERVPAALDAAFDALREPGWAAANRAIGALVAAEDGVAVTVERLERAAGATA